MATSKPSLRTFIRNIYTLFAYDIRTLLRDTRDRLEIESMRRFYDSPDSEQYREELECVFHHGLQLFPYEKLKGLEMVECGYDRHYHLPFVIHDKKRLYFPKGYSVEDVERMYRTYIEKENLLGGNYTKKMPHCYQSEHFKVNEGDVFVDVGAAEGLVALDVIDKVSKVIIIESDRRWIKALRATFAPYKTKCVILRKLVTDHDGRNTITLEQLLKKETDCSIFVKMDIEGFEKKVIGAAKDFLISHDGIKLACCTYHYGEDAQKLAMLFDQMGYHYEFSDGWMLFDKYDNTLLKPPFFRHGLIRAWK